MTEPLRIAHSSRDATPDPELARLIDEITLRIHAGETLDESALAAAHPRHAEHLRRLLPALTLLAELGCSVVSGDPGAWPLRRQPLAVGDFAGRFRIVRELGRGGMGVVYQAEHSDLSRPVALKVMLAGRFASISSLRRFQVETEIIAQLDHPNIVPIYEVGEQQGLPFFAMKLYPGGSLQDRLDTLAGHPRDAAKAAYLIAEAVHHAHQRGILHRDLKPSNILLDAVGAPSVADFGLARRMDADQDLTGSDAQIGSPPYMAPEQIAGSRGEITVSTDVYGLGSILYALLTGRPPFRGANALETLDQVRHRQPEPPTGPAGEVDRDLQTVCLKCLEKDPKHRYESAHALADDLTRWLRGEPIRARPSSLRHRIALWSRRPERVRDAGTCGLGLGVGMTCYAALGLILLGIGGITPPRPSAFAGFLLGWIAGADLPIAVFGGFILKGKRWAIPLGALWALGVSLWTLAYTVRLVEVDSGEVYSRDDSVARFSQGIILIFIFMTFVLLCGIAWHAERRNRPILADAVTA